MTYEEAKSIAQKLIKEQCSLSFDLCIAEALLDAYFKGSQDGIKSLEERLLNNGK